MKRLFIAVLMILSITTAFAQIVNNAEYFLDKDPGPGNGTPTSIGTPGISVSFQVHIPINLSPGFHWLGIRVKDSDGKWSLFQRRNFYVSQPGSDLPIITRAEYFFDTDPGVGGGTPLNIQTPGFSFSQLFNIPVPASMTAGTHYLAIRTRDQAGHWSLFQRDTIVVGGSSASITCPGNVVVTAASGQCSSIVNNIDPTVSPQGASYTYSLTGATTGNGAGTASGKSFNVGVTTVTYALTNAPATSCSFNVTVNSGTTASVTINTIRTSICSGQQVTFTATPVNGGNTPSYQWKLNGNNIAGAIYPTYQSSSLANGDVVSVVMTSSISCASPSSATSNLITMTVHPILTPSVSITASATTICSGQSVTFTATPTNGGIQPIYQWVKNGSYADQGAVYQTSALANGDSVYVILYNTTDCIIDDNITSNVIHITTSQMVTPSVSISQSPTIICSAATVTFTASPVNGGSTPNYQWKKNDINVGSNSATYAISAPVNGDVVKVVMTSSLGCANSPSATSNSITMAVNDSVQEFVSITASATTICAGTTVTFVGAESGGGSSTFQWKLNGNNVGTNSLIYRSDSLRNGDKVKLVNTPTYACSPTVISNEITITVNSSATPSVSILASTTNICPGQQVTFTATPVNGGATPSYQWKLNGNNVGSNSPTYQNATLQNGDSVRVVMTSSLVSLCQPTASSNRIIMSVGQMVTPSVSINASAIDICAGQQVTFTATPTNGGNNPIYQWKLNGNNVGSNSPTYQTTSLANADTVKVVMTSSLGCVTFPLSTSNSISMDVSTSVLPSVSITADLTYICQGELVKFTATPINGGNNPTYQWKLNGNNVGTNSNIYQSTSFANNDSIEVVMTSSLGCAVPRSVTSNNIFMTVTTAVTPQVSIESSSSHVCAGTLVTFTATPVNGGTPSYQWKLNGNNVGINYYKYENSSLSAGDLISVSMTTTLGCVTTSTAVSNSITMEASSSSTTYYRDLDGDGYGNSSSGTIQACGTTAGYASNNSDCNDNNAAVYPGAAEVCGNGIDDNCNGQTDENCTEDLPVLIVKTYPVKEGDVGYTIVDIEVRLDRPAVSAVRLNYATSNDDAIAGSDYLTANGVLIIPPGSSSATLQIKVIGDLLKESNERFWLNFTNPVNVVLPGDSRCRIMIIDNDKGKITTTAANNEQVPIKEEIFKIPTVTRRNQVWLIPQIGNYENEVLIVNVQGQVVSRFVNYHNQTALGNVSAGLYFYRIRIMESPGQYKYYSGRLLITE